MRDSRKKSETPDSNQTAEEADVAAIPAAAEAEALASRRDHNTHLLLLAWGRLLEARRREQARDHDY